MLISDGIENRGDLRDEATTARDFGVEVSVLEVPFAPEPEVLVRDLEFPDDVTLSTPFTITAEIYATAPTTPIASCGPSMSTTAFAASFAISILSPSIEPERSITMTIASEG